MKRRSLWIPGLLAALALAAFVSPWACPWPDGLDHVAEALGFRRHEQAVLGAPLPGYKVPGIADQKASTSVAGMAGALAVFGTASLLGCVLRRKKQT